MLEDFATRVPEWLTAVAAIASLFVSGTTFLVWETAARRRQFELRDELVEVRLPKLRDKLLRYRAQRIEHGDPSEWRDYPHNSLIGASAELVYEVKQVGRSVRRLPRTERRIWSRVLPEKPLPRVDVWDLVSEDYSPGPDPGKFAYWLEDVNRETLDSQIHELEEYLVQKISPSRWRRFAARITATRYLFR